MIVQCCSCRYFVMLFYLDQGIQCVAAAISQKQHDPPKDDGAGAPFQYFGINCTRYALTNRQVIVKITSSRIHVVLKVCKINEISKSFPQECDTLVNDPGDPYKIAGALATQFLAWKKEKWCQKWVLRPPSLLCAKDWEEWEPISPPHISPMCGVEIGSHFY